jgi:hypothetical protein
VAALGLERSIIRLDDSAVSQILGEASLTIGNPDNPHLKQLVVKKARRGLKILSENQSSEATWNKRCSLTRVLITDRRFTPLFAQEPELLPISVDQLYALAATEEDNELIKLLVSHFSIPTDHSFFMMCSNDVQRMESILQHPSISSENLRKMASIIWESSDKPEILKNILRHLKWDHSKNQEATDGILNRNWESRHNEFLQVILDHGQVAPPSIERVLTMLVNLNLLHSSLALIISRHLPPSTILNKIRENPLNIENDRYKSAFVCRLLETSEGRALLYDAVKNDPDLRGALLHLFPSVILEGSALLHEAVNNNLDLRGILLHPYSQLITIRVAECIDSVIRPSLTRLALHPVKVALCTLLATAAISDFSSKWYH